MARWRWRSSTAWSKERSSSRSKARLTAPLWPKPRIIRPERGSSQLLPYFCAHQRPERNPTHGSLSTAKLVPFFAATDISFLIWLLEPRNSSYQTVHHSRVSGQIQERSTPVILVLPELLATKATLPRRGVLAHVT